MNNDQQRRLAAIMFTDMVGYSALTQEDESLALELLEEHRQILRPLFPMHGGHEVETAGDAFFVEFSSALEAVKCAIDIQKTLWDRNTGISEKKQIKIRIGIHLGDVVHKGDNVLGDGVNIAARIEPLAQAGGICVSEDVARQVQNKIEFPLKKIETKQLKNIKIPVAVYAVGLSWLKEVPDAPSDKKHKKLPVYFIAIISIILLAIIGYKFTDWYYISDESTTKGAVKWENSIAVLPFTDMSPQKDQEYFCDGMTEQILTNLAQLNNLKVIARTSVMKFKHSGKTIPEIGEELNVENILEGSIRKFGNRLRVTAQLVKSVDGSHIWAEDYDSESTDLFAIQDDISQSIAVKLYEKLTVSEVDLLTTRQTVDLEAYEYYLRAEHIHRNAYWSTSSKENFNTSEQLFLKAIDLDSTYAPAYAGLVDLYNTYWNSQATEEEKEEYLALQEKYIRIAYNLDPESAEVNRVMGWVYGAKNDTEKEVEYMKKAVRLDVNDPENLRALGICYDLLGLKNLAQKYYARCIQLDPYDAKYYYYHGNVYFSLGKNEVAKSDLKRAMDLEPNNPKYLLLYTWILYQMEEFEQADAQASRFMEFFPDNEGARFLKALQYAIKGDKQQAINVDLSPDHKILIFLYLKMSDEVLRWNEMIYDTIKDSERSKYLILKYHPLNDFLQSKPRYQEIVAKHKIIYDNNLRKYGDGRELIN